MARIEFSIALIHNEPLFYLLIIILHNAWYTSSNNNESTEVQTLGVIRIQQV